MRLRATRLFSIGAGGTRPSWSPLSLFAAGEAGVWYDPSDLTTMFQDIDALTPVTSVGQAVALILDKSQGTPTVTQAVTDGTFDNPAAWNTTSGAAGWTVTDGKAVLNSAGGNALLEQLITIPIGAVAAISFDIDALSASAALSYIRLGTLQTGIGTVDCLSSFGPRTLGKNYGFFINTTNSSSVWLKFATDSNARTCTIDNVRVAVFKGRPAYQPANASRPVLAAISGYNALQTDGVDDFLITPTLNLTSTDKLSLFMGLRKLNDTTTAVAIESGTNSGTVAGTFAVFAPISTTPGFRFRARGTATADIDSEALYPAPTTQVITCTANIPVDATISVGGATRTNLAGAGTGNFSSQPLYTGRRAGTTLPFAGCFFGIILRGAATSAADIVLTEAWLNARTGAY